MAPPFNQLRSHGPRNATFSLSPCLLMHKPKDFREISTLPLYIKEKVIFLTLILQLAVTASVSAQVKITELNFNQPPPSESDISRTLQSLVKVQGTGGLYQDGLYLMTHFGDREEMFQSENQSAIDNPWRDDTWRYCSIFSKAADDSVMMGRNWDNQNVGSIIVSLYHPPNGYSSISFARAIDMGFPLNLHLEQIKSSELGGKLLLAPFYATDGINERGLAVAVAGVRQITHSAKSDKELVFVTFMVRKILDRASNVEEAVDLVEDFIPFDLDRNSLNTHFFVADSSGKSVILEYAQDQWRTIYPDNPWQVLTNKPIYNVPDKDLRDKCCRYRSISETLESAETNADRETGMKILQDVAQRGTTWSVIYSPPTRELHFSVYQKWDVVYHSSIP
ncbi:MAG: linear amide C-N hydrolase [Candidatus Zixiibacteriota bacterium]|nr:MAG: linear amide C-N hydrolase [candidate division Zixibacteria bacterium]